jgi:hypothetical protein
VVPELVADLVAEGAAIICNISGRLQVENFRTKCCALTRRAPSLEIVDLATSNEVVK